MTTGRLDAIRHTAATLIAELRACKPQFDAYLEVEPEPHQLQEPEQWSAGTIQSNTN